MEKPRKDETQKTSSPRSFLRSPNVWFMLVILAVVGVVLLLNQGPSRSTITYKFFREQVENKDENGKTRTDSSGKLLGPNVTEVKIGEREATGKFVDPPLAPRETGKDEKDRERLHDNFRVEIPRGDARDRVYELLDTHNVNYTVQPPDNTSTIFWVILFLLPVVFMLVLWISYRRNQNQFLGGGFLSGFSKSPAKRYEALKQPTTFDDVAGLDGVKADLLEIVEYLKNPKKFQRLGGRVPKGVLLNGPPGTGKTLLARAVAGEADVPYFSVSGSEFIQMFVGVGASRVRDLFKTAKEASPAIIFIDEIDAVGRQRGAGLGGGHDEREQTLNQILNEMDGFTQNDSVIILAATNRPDVLDPALLRPGRFDRHVTVGRPTKKGRIEIFKVHVRDVPLADDVNLETLASGAIGMTGADIRNIVNESALWAARHDKNKVEMCDFEYARDKILMGAKREEVLLDEEKEKTAYHEAGHTMMAWMLPGAHKVHKVTIVPRGRTLGSTQMLPLEDRLNMSEGELRDHLIVMLGGRAAERLVYNESTVGAENDLERATSTARRMVTHWGMSERLGPVSYKMSEDDPFLGREIHQQRQFSEHTMELIDEEVARILHESAERALTLLSEHRGKLEKLTHALIQEEELDERQITELIGPSIQSRAESNGKPHRDKTSSDKPREGAAKADKG